jgi:hypothetical protein
VILLLVTQSPKPRMSMVNGQCSGYRLFPIGISPLMMPTSWLPKSRTPRCRVPRREATWTPLAPAPHDTTSRWDFANRGFSTQSFLLLETTNAETPMLWIRATCPSSSRRLQSNRGIALRDFDVHVFLTLANPDSSICDGK